jgi:hypothetical protein
LEEAAARASSRGRTSGNWCDLGKVGREGVGGLYPRYDWLIWQRRVLWRGKGGGGRGSSPQVRLAGRWLHGSPATIQLRGVDLSHGHVTPAAQVKPHRRGPGELRAVHDVAVPEGVVESLRGAGLGGALRGEL